MKMIPFRFSAPFLALCLLGACAGIKSARKNNQRLAPEAQAHAKPRYETLYQNPEPVPPRSTAKNIVVPDRETAIRIAKAIWAPVYGEKVIQAGKSYDAVLNDGIWNVSAWLPAGALEAGTAIIDISQADGRVSRIAHGQFEPGHEWR